MKFKKSLLTLAITSAAALTLSGCGGTDKQDSGSKSTNATISSGVAVDGPIIRAQVFYDLNGNNKKDSFEPGALTDNAGHYNTVPAMSGNPPISYCLGAAARPEFCLTLTSAQQQALTDDTKIIVSGGYDLYTGEPFEGSMSFPAKSANDLTELIAITPLTSMLNNEVNSDFATILALLPVGFDQSRLFNLNFLESEENFAPEAFAVTYQMHKYVTIISDWVEDHYDAIDDGEDIQSDISGLIYKQFTDLNAGQYQAAWDKLVVDINALYNDAGLPQEDVPNQTEVNALIANLTAVNNAAKEAFGDSLGTDSTFTFANHKARIRGVEVVVSKILQGQDSNTIRAAIAALNDGDYLTHLGGDTDGNFNFTQVLEENGDIIAAAANAKDTSGSDLASDLAGKTLSFEDDDDDIEAKAAIFFTGAENANQGDIHLCIKYVDNSDFDNRLDGDYISGSWETLAALNNTVLLELDYLGGRSAVLKKIGLTDPSGSGTETDYRFDFNNEISNFTSDQDLEDINDLTEVITSQEACTTWVNDQSSNQVE